MMTSRVHRRSSRWLAFAALAAAVMVAIALRLGTGGTPAPALKAPAAAAGVGGGLEAPGTPLEWRDGHSGDDSAFETGKTLAGSPGSGPRRIGGYTEAEHQTFKENYYCELARAARAACAAADRGVEAHDRCLTLQSYYTYSRHCGYQP